MCRYFFYHSIPFKLLFLNISTYLFIILFLYSPNLNSQTLTAEQIYKKVAVAVVVILAYDLNDELSMQGSGVVINDKGYVVTNYHVLEGCERLEILHNEEIVPYVDIIGIDVERDILILKIEESKFPAITIGVSQKLNIGQRVYAIGSPLGFENTISEGIISGLRSYEEFGKNFIQITASISSGSSGGAVVNDKGELIGISTLTAKEGQNLNFAIPINDVLDVKINSYSKNDSYKNFELFAKGYDAYEKGNYQKAITHFTSFIQEYPNYPNAYYNRGLAKYMLGDYQGTIKDYNKAIELDPDDADSYYDRGLAKYKLEYYGGAIQDFNKVIKINPYHSSAYIMRGLVKQRLEDYESAIKDYNRAIEIDPNDPLAYFNRGLSNYLIGDEKSACMDWSKAEELGDEDAYDLILEYCE